MEETESDKLSSSPINPCSSKNVGIFKVIFKKKQYEISFDLDSTISQLKDHLHAIIGVPKEMQKVMVKGLAHDDKSLKETGIISGSKVMVIGSTFDDVLALSNQTSPVATSDEPVKTTATQSLSQQTLHKKIIDKGLPDDVMVGVKNSKEPLPSQPLNGMLNRNGGKVRLTFKMECDQLWIGTKERTEKISMSSIKTIVNEPIEGHEEYNIIGIQLGPTEASRYWIYWVPSQYVDAIKVTVLGKWHYF